MKGKITLSKLSYLELLATFPWVALAPSATLPTGEIRRCEWRYKVCKAPARLLYIDLDGSVHGFCHNHLYGARMSENFDVEPGEPGYEEIKRNKDWERQHVTFENEDAS